MSDIKIDAKLKSIAAKPNKDGDVMVNLVIEADFCRDAMRLMPHTGKDFTVILQPFNKQLPGIEEDDENKDNFKPNGANRRRFGNGYPGTNLPGLPGGDGN